MKNGQPIAIITRRTSHPIRRPSDRVCAYNIVRTEFCIRTGGTRMRTTTTAIIIITIIIILPSTSARLTHIYYTLLLLLYLRVHGDRYAAKHERRLTGRWACVGHSTRPDGTRRRPFLLDAAGYRLCRIFTDTIQTRDLLKYSFDRFVCDDGR